MKLLLFGRDGQLGRALQGTLASLGELVTVGHADADFEQPGELPRLVVAHAPDVIVNAAAYTAVDRAESEPDRARLVNAEAVAMLADVAHRSGALLVHYSTDYVFDGANSSPYREADAANPINAYGASKHRGDVAVAASGCRHLIFRVGWVYAGGGAHFGRTMLRLARQRTALDVVGDQVGTPTSAGFVADVTARAIGAAGSRRLDLGLYHLAPKGAIDRAAYARFLVGEAIAAGLPATLLPEAIRSVPTADYPTPARRPLNGRLDTTRLQAALGIDLPDWRDEARRWVAAALAGGEI